MDTILSGEKTITLDGNQYKVRTATYKTPEGVRIVAQYDVGGGNYVNLGERDFNNRNNWIFTPAAGEGFVRALSTPTSSAQSLTNSLDDSTYNAYSNQFNVSKTQAKQTLISVPKLTPTVVATEQPETLPPGELDEGEGEIPNTPPIQLIPERGVGGFGKKGLYKYPLSTIEDNTDYFLLSIKEYVPIGPTLIRTSNGQFNSPQRVKNKNSIILPMPSKIQDGNSVDYASRDLDGITAAFAQSALGAMQTTGLRMDDLGGFTRRLAENAIEPFNAKIGENLKNVYLRGLAAQAANIPGIGNITKEQLLARESGGILNPNMELLFNGVRLRTFKFSFKMTPRNKGEAEEIKNIIKILKINMAPKVVKDNNSFLSTPNVFDIQYMKGNSSHPFLHLFKTCALTDMAVDYTGENIYATYGNTKDEATPISMIMDLTFRELEPIYDSDYDNVKQGVGY